MLRKWIPAGFGLVAILTLSTLSSATAAVGSLGAPIMVSPAGQDAGDVQLVSSGTTITAVWAQFVGEYSTQIQASSSVDGGVTWNDPTIISTAGSYAGSPDLVTDGTTITAAWDGTYAGASRIQAATSTDGGVTWSSPSVLPSTGIYDEIPRLVTTTEARSRPCGRASRVLSSTSALLALSRPPFRVTVASLGATLRASQTRASSRTSLR